jgi:hypothetical protein
LKGFVKDQCFFKALLIAVEGAETPAGRASHGRPRRRKKRRGGSRTARGKRSAWNENQQNPV